MAIIRRTVPLWRAGNYKDSSQRAFGNAVSAFKRMKPSVSRLIGGTNGSLLQLTPSLPRPPTFQLNKPVTRLLCTSPTLASFNYFSASKQTTIAASPVHRHSANLSEDSSARMHNNHQTSNSAATLTAFMSISVTHRRSTHPLDKVALSRLLSGDAKGTLPR